MQSTVPQAEWRTSTGCRSADREVGRDRSGSLDLGDQITAEWVPLVGITYDSKDDLLDVALDRYDHLIRHPKQIVVDEEQGRLASVAVVDADGTTQIVRMKQPLILPATASPQ
jgi:hypothetical protein